MKEIEKAPKATTNTFMRQVPGISIHSATLKGQRVIANVMFTSDDHGETLSIYDPSTKKQIVVSYEDVEQLIAYTRTEKAKEATTT